MLVKNILKAAAIAATFAATNAAAAVPYSAASEDNCRGDDFFSAENILTAQRNRITVLVVDSDPDEYMQYNGANRHIVTNASWDYCDRRRGIRQMLNTIAEAERDGIAARDLCLVIPNPQSIGTRLRRHMCNGLMPQQP